MKRSSAVILFVAALVGCDQADPTAPQANQTTRVQHSHGWDVLNPGNYTDADVIIKSPYNPEIIDRYTYWAQRWQGNPVDGRFTYRTTTLSGAARVSGKILCFTIIGNQARLGGVVTRSNTPDIPVGTELTWSVTDNYAKWGDPDDTGSALLGADAELYCELGLPYPESPLEGYSYVYIER